MADDTDEPVGRGTAPQTPFGAREVQLGLLVLAIGLLVAFGVPAAFTL